MPKKGRAKLYKEVTLTNRRVDVAGVVAVKEERMKDAWLVAVKLLDELMKAAVARNQYGKRFRIEETFRDLNDPRCGVG